MTKTTKKIWKATIKTIDAVRINYKNQLAELYENDLSRRGMSVAYYTTG